jgi:hypothetical protein
MVVERRLRRRKSEHRLSSLDHMQVRLTRKLADCIDGVDLSERAVGEIFNLADREALFLVAEGWAVPVDPAAGSVPIPQFKSTISPHNAAPIRGPRVRLP